jgi:GH15 family glucan-1,4-alpha-glucosidase
MYGLHGEHKLEELELTHLAGYMNSKPVRIGNGAYDQMQLVRSHCSAHVAHTQHITAVATRPDD